ncbi:formin-like protein 3 [Syzygium oleosum]|uniref:formin-like protein 3 n=1 Tax=Syzygium oleosum TaxID=219896 RepID=UPI0024B879A2|nr:formin-like protein 3 [Syzygium oleosum]
MRALIAVSLPLSLSFLFHISLNSITFSLFSFPSHNASSRLILVLSFSSSLSSSVAPEITGEKRKADRSGWVPRPLPPPPPPSRLSPPFSAPRLPPPPSRLRLVASASRPPPSHLPPPSSRLHLPLAASASSPPPCGLRLNLVASALPRLSSRLRLRQPRGLRLRPPTFRLRPPASASFSALPLVASPSRPPPRRLSLAASTSAPVLRLRLSLVASAGEKSPPPSRFHLRNQSNFFFVGVKTDNCRGFVQWVEDYIEECRICSPKNVDAVNSGEASSENEELAIIKGDLKLIRRKIGFIMSMIILYGVIVIIGVNLDGYVELPLLYYDQFNKS